MQVESAHCIFPHTLPHWPLGHRTHPGLSARALLKRAAKDAIVLHITTFSNTGFKIPTAPLRMRPKGNKETNLAAETESCLPSNLDRWMRPPLVQMLAEAAVRLPTSEPPYFAHACSLSMVSMRTLAWLLSRTNRLKIGGKMEVLGRAI